MMDGSEGSSRHEGQETVARALFVARMLDYIEAQMVDFPTQDCALIWDSIRVLASVEANKAENSEAQTIRSKPSDRIARALVREIQTRQRKAGAD